MRTEPSNLRLSQATEDHLPRDWQWLTQFSIAGNEVWRVIALFAAILLALIVGRMARYFLTAAARRFTVRGRTLVAAAFTALARAAGFVALVLGLRIGLEFLVLHPTVAAVGSVVTGILAIIAIGYAAYLLVNVVDQWLWQLAQKTPSKLDDMLVPLVRKSLRSTIVILVLVQIATMLSDKPVTSIIAGLGVGGLAVGLAAQDTIKNFFGSMMIFGDRPFELGEQIVVDGKEGTVEIVGFRSTRFRTPEGYLVTIPNGDLANRPIVNMSKRRSLARRFTLSLSPDLPLEKVETALALVKQIVASAEGISPTQRPQVVFSEITPGALVMSIAYWVEGVDSARFAAVSEQVNFEILRRFAAASIRLVGSQP